MRMSHRLGMLQFGLKREHPGSHNFSNEGDSGVLACSLAEKLIGVHYFKFLNLPGLMFFGWGYIHPHSVHILLVQLVPLPESGAEPGNGC